MWKLSSGIFLGWSLGANDSANIFGTGVSTGIVKYKTAILLTAIFVIVGAVIDGPKCMTTVRDLSLLLPIDAFCCTLASAATMAILTYFALPASASQSIIGALIGAGIISGAPDFSGLYKIIICWVLTPVSGILLGYTIHRVTGYILDRTVINLTNRNLLYYIGTIVAGSYGAYCLGGNNAANATGVYVGAGILSANTAALIGGLSIACGVLTYSRKVMMTVGNGIVPLDPFSAFVVVLAEALTLHIFTQAGVPVSSSQAVVGAVVGVGLVGSLRTVSPKILAKIAVGWIITPVWAGLLAYLMIRFINV